MEENEKQPEQEETVQEVTGTEPAEMPEPTEAAVESVEESAEPEAVADAPTEEPAEAGGEEQRKCAACGVVLPPAAKFCGVCGAEVIPAADPEVPAEKKSSGKKKGLIIGLICGAGTLLLVAAILLGIPFGRYFWADALLKQGQSQKASSIFEDLGDFLESPEKLQACKYGQAVVWMEEGKRQEAKEIFVSLGDYQDCPERIKECDYQQALEWMDQGKLQEAQNAFEALGDYKDSTEQITECKYLYASALMEQEDYQQAMQILTEMESYKDSQEKITECKYQTAVKLLEEGKHAEAEEILTALEDYKDTKELLKECEYQEAVALLDAGEIVKGYDALIALKDYKDSAERAKEVKTAYTRIKGKSKIFVNANWQFYYQGEETFYAGLTTKKVDSQTVKITVVSYGDPAEEIGEKTTNNMWEFTGKWDPATGRLNYTKGKHYTVTYTMVDPQTDKKTKTTKTIYSNGTGYFYYQNSKLYWKTDNGENTKNSYFKRAK